MKRTPLITAAVLTAASAAAIALAIPTLSSAANASLNMVQEKASSLLQQMTKNLHESGFTHVNVQANDKSGNPVTMFITPNSMAEITIHKKSEKPETMFITPNSMAEVPTNGSSDRL
jgi:hypothetical protein